MYSIYTLYGLTVRTKMCDFIYLLGVVSWEKQKQYLVCVAAHFGDEAEHWALRIIKGQALAQEPNRKSSAMLTNLLINSPAF